MRRQVIEKTPQQLKSLRLYAIENDLPEDIYENFGTYAQYMVPNWGDDKLDWEWFHFEMTDNFQGLLDGLHSYLSLETHSQIGKSVLVALLISFIFGHSPDKSIMYFTYNETAAVKFTKNYMYGFMGSKKYKLIFPFVTLKNELNKDDHSADISMQKKRSTLADNAFNLINPFKPEEEYRGSFIALGISQGSHGRSADIMILDDYVDKADSIKSEGFREKLRVSLENDIFLRFQANTIFMLICTRWYEDDPIGILKDKMPILFAGFEAMGLIAPAYKEIKIRAEYRTSDINSKRDPRTVDGEWLWKPMLAKYLLAKGGKYYNATFNCDPTDVTMEKQLRESDFGYYHSDELPKNGGRIFFCMDGASTTNKRSDHTAIGMWLIFGRKRYLLKLWYVKLKIPKLEALVESILTVEYPNYHRCLIEFANSGVAVCQYLEERHIRHTPLGFSGIELVDNRQPKKKSKKDTGTKSNSKIDRYYRMIPQFSGEEKRILLPVEPIEHQDTFIKQLTTFTGAANEENDMVDMASYLINYTTTNVVTLSGYIPVKSTNSQVKNGMCYNLPNANYFMKR